MTRPRVTAFAFLLAATAAAACTTYPVEPAAPTFTKDVQPILAAHCVRCHGAGNSLTNELHPKRSGIIDCYLDQLADRGGDCTIPVDGGPALLSECKPGARYCATAPLTGTTTRFDYYVFEAADGPNPMPPPPAAPLNDWEMNTLKRWAANGAP